MSHEGKLLWNNEGGHSVKTLVDVLAAAYGERVKGDDIRKLTDQAFELMLPRKDWKGAAAEAGWGYDRFAKLMHKGLAGYRDFETPDWERLCGYEKIEAPDREGLDYLIVSDWLAERLIAEGEKVVKGFAGMNVWSNTVEGPAYEHPIILDLAEAYEPVEDDVPAPRFR